MTASKHKDFSQVAFDVVQRATSETLAEPKQREPRKAAPKQSAAVKTPRKAKAP